MYDYDSASLTSSIVINIISIVALWRIFTKVGEKGWKAIIPFYNLYVLFELTWGSGIKFLFLIIPFFNIYVIIKTCINLARAFGRNGIFTLGLVFLPNIFMIVLAFSDCEYLGVPKKINGQIVYENKSGCKTSYNTSESGQTTYEYTSNGNDTNHSYYDNNTNNNNAYYTSNGNNIDNDQPKQKKKICPSCGFPVPDDVKYCPGCGKKLN